MQLRIFTLINLKEKIGIVKNKEMSVVNHYSFTKNKLKNIMSIIEF